MDNVDVQAAELKPMSLSELLDRTFTLYRNRFWLFCGLMLMPQIAIMICSLIVVVGFPIRIVPVTADPTNQFAFLQSIQARIAPTILLLFAQILFGAIALGAVTITVSELYLGRAVSIRDAYRAIRGRVSGLLGLVILLFLINVVFLFAVILAAVLVGGIAAAVLNSISPFLTVAFILLLVLAALVLVGWVVMRFAVSIPVFLLEKQGAVDSMTRSGVLTRGHRWRIFGAVVVMYIVVSVVQFLFVMPFSILTFVYAAKGLLPMWIQVGQAVAGAIAGTVAGPLFMITLALIYYDVRIRKEGFDLESMMNALKPSTETGGTADAPPPLQPAS
jgi:MFS family permease